MPRSISPSGNPFGADGRFSRAAAETAVVEQNGLARTHVTKPCAPEAAMDGLLKRRK